MNNEIINRIVNQIEQAAEYNAATNKWLVQELEQADDIDGGNGLVIGYTLLSVSGDLIKPKIYLNKMQADKAATGMVRVKGLSPDYIKVVPLYHFIQGEPDECWVRYDHDSDSSSTKKKSDAITMTPEQWREAEERVNLKG